MTGRPIFITSRSEGFGEDTSAIVLPMTRFTLTRIPLSDILMHTHPILPYCMHAVRTAVSGSGDCYVACRTFVDRTCMPLCRNTLEIVFLTCTGIDRMGRTVACTTLHPFVSTAVSVETFPLYGSVLLGGKASIERCAEGTRRKIGHCFGIPMSILVATLTFWLIQPAVPSLLAYGRHTAVAALALHFERSVGIFGIAHRSPQTLCRRTRMAGIACVSVRLVVELLTC